MITVLKSPVVTEKATKVGQQNQYVFLVDPSANKIQIKGKVKQRYTRSGWQIGKTNLKKKAYITLKAGQTIDIVAGEGAED